MLYSMLEMLFRHRWRYLTLLVVLPLLGAVACIPLFPKGTASELIWVQDQNMLNASPPIYDLYLTPAQVTQGDFEQYIQTRAFAAGVYKELLKKGVSAEGAVTIADGLSTRVVAVTTGNNLVLLTYTSEQPSLGPLVLGVAWDVYQTHSAASANSQLKVAEQAYQQQVSRAQEQVDGANTAVSEYLSKHPSETPQTTTDPALSQLLLNLTSAQQALQAAQSKLAGAQAQASTNQISSSSLFTVVDPPHNLGGHLSRLPTKQMMIVAALFWALAALSLFLTARLARVVRHPNQLRALLGVEVAAVMQPVPAPRTHLALPRSSRGAAA